MANGSEMETLSAATRRLQSAGYEGNWYAAPGGHLVCNECGTEVSVSDAVVDEVVRFEGASDPGDESILFALRSPDGHRGLYGASYGAYMPEDDALAMQALRSKYSTTDS